VLAGAGDADAVGALVLIENLAHRAERRPFLSFDLIWGLSNKTTFSASAARHRRRSPNRAAPG
jgi:hypothetical protein